MSSGATVITSRPTANRLLQLSCVVLAGVLVRAPFFLEALRTPLDGDTSIVGLMARHPGRALTTWGQPYGSVVEPWLAAPFVAALGPTVLPLRLLYLLLGLALIPCAYELGKALDEQAALPAAALMACPSPYLILTSVLPTPLYPGALALCAGVLVLALSLARRLGNGERCYGRLAAWGTLAGLAIGTHAMAASVAASSGAWLWLRARGRRVALVVALLPLLATSAPWWSLLLRSPEAVQLVSASGPRRPLAAHLAEVLPRSPETLADLLGARTPLVPDDASHLIRTPRAVRIGLLGLYGLGLTLAIRKHGLRSASGVLAGVLALTLVAFVLPERSTPHSIRYLTPLYLPLVALVAAAPVVLKGSRRPWALVLALAGLHLAADARLLGALNRADRSAPPFLLPDLAPVRQALEAHGIRRAYASYGPAYRLTYDSRERIIVSQPWNERFRHYPLPCLDEVDFAQDVAWILTPSIPSDLPSPSAFESALGAIGARWERTTAGAAEIYYGFVPPYSPAVVPLSSAGAAGDGDPGTYLTPAVDGPVDFALPTPMRLDALTLVAGVAAPSLPVSMDVETSEDGAVFEVVARRRRREERFDLRWVNGHPQYVLDHDLVAVPLGGRRVAAVRITPVASSEEWSLGEILLHPSVGDLPGPWPEWIDPNLSWAERRATLAGSPRRDREDWYSRVLIAARHR